MITKSTALIIEYEKILMGEKKEFSRVFFNNEKKQNELIALDVFRYAFEKLLQWEPDEIRDGISLQLLKDLKIDSLLKYINFPQELSSEDLFYIPYRLYPTKIRYTKRDFVLHFYHKILNKKVDKFPKTFFIGVTGTINACICLQDYIIRNMPVGSIEELYKEFSKKDIKKTLKQAKLKNAALSLFSSPLEYLHMSLPDEQKNEFYYNYYLFNSQYTKIKEENAKSHEEEE